MTQAPPDPPPVINALPPARHRNGSRIGEYAPWVAIGLTAAIAIAGWVDRLAASGSASHTRIQLHDRELQSLDAMQRRLDHDLAEIKAELRWIRRELQDRRSETGRDD